MGKLENLVFLIGMLATVKENLMRIRISFCGEGIGKYSNVETLKAEGWLKRLRDYTRS